MCAGAKSLVAKGLADSKKLAIDGGSAGGFTTLGALAFRDVFTAGCSLYGVADCSALAEVGLLRFSICLCGYALLYIYECYYCE